MSTQRITGAWKGSVSSMLIDPPSTQLPQWTRGGLRLDKVGAQPTQRQPWSVIGFSVRIRAYVLRLGPQQAYGHLGDMWAGLLVDTNITDNFPTSTAPPGELPPDLSSFTKIFDGSQDALSMVNTSAGLTFIPKPIATTYLLPLPLDVPAGSALSMAFVLTPSLIAGGAEIVVRDGSYAILYEYGNTSNGSNG